MMRVNFHYDTPGWAHHHRCEALVKYAPPGARCLMGVGKGSKSMLADCDLALQLCYTHVSEIRKRYRQAGCRPLIVVGLNVGWNEQNAAHLARLIEEADHVVVNNRDAWERAGRPEGVTWISNGVDLSLFRMRNRPAERRPRILWTGSAFHRRLKGYDDFVVPIVRRLWRERGIAADVRLVDSHGGATRWRHEDMADWYQTGTVYLCASETEGTPNPALEAAASGCVVCSTRVGNMPELIEDGVNGRLVDRNFEAIYEGVVDCLDRYQEMQPAMEQRIASWDWRARAGEYWSLFARLLGERGSQAAAAAA